MGRVPVLSNASEYVYGALVCVVVIVAVPMTIAPAEDASV